MLGTAVQVGFYQSIISRWFICCAAGLCVYNIQIERLAEHIYKRTKSGIRNNDTRHLNYYYLQSSAAL